MEKSLRIKILEYLRDNHATDLSIDIKPVFSEQLIDKKERWDVSVTLEKMTDEKLIECSHHQYSQMNIVRGGVLEPVPYYIKARITAIGEQYLRDREPKQATYHVEGSQGVIIGDKNQSLDLNVSNTNNANNSPNTIPTITPSAKGESISKRLFITVIGGLILYLILAAIKAWFPFMK